MGLSGSRGWGAHRWDLRVRAQRCASPATGTWGHHGLRWLLGGLSPGVLCFPMCSPWPPHASCSRIGSGLLARSVVCSCPRLRSSAGSCLCKARLQTPTPCKELFLLSIAGPCGHTATLGLGSWHCGLGTGLGTGLGLGPGLAGGFQRRLPGTA